MASERVTQKTCQECGATYTGTPTDPKCTDSVRRHKAKSGHKGGFKSATITRSVKAAPSAQRETASKTAKLDPSRRPTKFEVQEIKRKWL
jgi:hypothetical protein